MNEEDNDEMTYEELISEIKEKAVDISRVLSFNFPRDGEPLLLALKDLIKLYEKDYGEIIKQENPISSGEFYEVRESSDNSLNMIDRIGNTWRIDLNTTPKIKESN